MRPTTTALLLLSACMATATVARAETLPFDLSISGADINQQYHAGSIETLREGMFTGKYFDADVGAFKLVYYPALGQTSPDQSH